MSRRLASLVLVIAALLAVEPLLHQHPLQQDSIPASACAVCATGVGQVPLMTAVVAAPQTVVYTLQTAAVIVRTITASPTIPSRAPPA